MGNGGNQLAPKMGRSHSLAVAAVPIVSVMSVAAVASRFFSIAGHFVLLPLRSVSLTYLNR
jgi:hypothetical protein